MVWTGRGQSTMRREAARTRGRATKLTRFVEAVLTGAHAVPLSHLVAVTKATIAVRESLSSGVRNGYEQETGETSTSRRLDGWHGAAGLPRSRRPR